MVLGRRRLLLECDQVTLAPYRFGGRGQHPISIPYSDILVIENVEPEPGRPGVLAVGEPELGKRAAVALRLRDGEVIAVAYPRRSELRMRSSRHQLQKRVRAARQSG